MTCRSCSMGIVDPNYFVDFGLAAEPLLRAQKGRKRADATAQVGAPTARRLPCDARHRRAGRKLARYAGSNSRPADPSPAARLG